MGGLARLVRRRLIADRRRDDGFGGDKKGMSMNLPAGATTILAKMGEDEFSIRCFDTRASKSILAQILKGKTYPIIDFIGEVGTVLDVGANIGAFAIFSSLMYPGAKVHALEPAAEPFWLLEENARQFANIDVYNTGLFSKDCTMPLYKGDIDSVTASVGHSRHNSTLSEVVALRAADRWMRENGLDTPDILKVDTEGCEIGILESLREWLPEIKVLYLEYHSENDRRAIDGLLRDSHVLLAGTVHAPHRGEFTYVARNAFPTDDARDELEIIVDF